MVQKKSILIKIDKKFVLYISINQKQITKHQNELKQHNECN